MPRRIPPILRTVRRGQHGPENINPGQPALWNAKRRIKSSQGLSPRDRKAYKAHPDTFDWRNGVSPDVARFIDQNPTLIQTPEEKKAITHQPSRYFSRPHNVPTSSRKQVFFPNFAVVLQRTPHLSPHYAAFIVPLWFSKLDLKSYLKELYKVDVLHIRSWVMPGHKGRHPTLNPRSQGEGYRTKSTKKMTVQLVEPFVWPAEITDLEGTEWNPAEFYRTSKAQVDMNRQESQWGKLNPHQEHRTTIAQQARELLEGKRTWKPTWTQIPKHRRLLEGGMTKAPRESKVVVPDLVLPLDNSKAKSREMRD